MITLLDNYDSFTYNLAQALEVLGATVSILRNDSMRVEEIVADTPEALILSSGPGRPEQAGIALELTRRLAGQIPILGVNLGHLIIGTAFNAAIVPARSIMHGKTSRVTHQGQGIYSGLQNPFIAGRYHSFALDIQSLPAELLVEATADDGEIMGIRHKQYPIFGVQFQPDSVLTPAGKRLLRNFLSQNLRLKNK